MSTVRQCGSCGAWMSGRAIRCTRCGDVRTTVLSRDCCGGMAQQHGSETGVNLDERWTTEELTVEERRRAPEKDAQLTQALKYFDDYLVTARRFFELPYANDVAFRITGVRDAIDRLLDACDASRQEQ